MSRAFLAFISVLFVFAATAAAQDRGLAEELGRSLKTFEIVRVDPGAALYEARGAGRLAIPLAGRTVELSLTPRDLRAANYAAVDTGASGARRIDAGTVTTFKGKVAGESGSQVRLTIDGESVEGYLMSGGEVRFIEPARNFSKLAGPDELVVFAREDLIRTGTISCPSELVGKVESGMDFVQSRLTPTSRTFKLLRLATEADFAFVNSTGSPAAANAKALEILNAVEGLYEAELGITISVVFQHTWAVADPFDAPRQADPTRPSCTSSAEGSYLCNFQDYWNTNFPVAEIPRDAAHMFTARSNLMARGLAFIGEVCRRTSHSYGFSGRIYPDWNWEAGNFLITAHEVAHNLGANHAGTSSGCAGDNLMSTQLSWLTPLSFCPFSRTEISGYVATNGTCLRSVTRGQSRFDFDGDQKSDIAVFRPSNGVWYIANSGNSGFNIFQFGLEGDRPVSADYDGDGKADAAVYRAGVWYRLKSATGTFDAVSFGVATDIPAPADFDGDGRADIAVFRPSNGVWHRLNSSDNSYAAAQFGSNGDVPVPADYDGDGKADINVYRGSNGVWYRLNSANGAFSANQFGLNGDVPLPGDFDGDGKSDPAVWRPSTGVWYALRSGDGSLLASAFGLPTDVPVAADYDGDGKTDISVFRPSDGVWHRLSSSNGAYAAVQFGVRTDIPVPSSLF